MGSDTELTPMMAQYRRIKGELPRDALLLFRLGDFYEMFFDDAKVGAQLLNVALTRRGDIPMCGIPFHAAGGYIARILRAGRKVALCDQIEEARSRPRSSRCSRLSFRTRTGPSRPRRRCSPCASISRSRRSTGLG